MQPYFLPYIGYFQLIAAVDKFVIYDDVNFINKGWVNRNSILINNSSHIFTIPLNKASQNKKICDIELIKENKWREKLIKMIYVSYKKAPYFDSTFSLISRIFNFNSMFLNHFIINSIELTVKHIGLKNNLISTSKIYQNDNLKGVDRILDICQKENTNLYINLPGGRSIYNSQKFKDFGIDIKFLEPNKILYSQESSNFVPWLSILDVLMFNGQEKTKLLLNEFTISP
jgi:hypothetical protein